MSVLFRTSHPQQEAHRCVRVSQTPHCCATFPMCPPKSLCTVTPGSSPPRNATILGGEILLKGVESRSHWGDLKLPVQGLLELQNCLPLGVNPNQQPGTHSSRTGSIGPWDLQVKLWVRYIYLSPQKLISEVNTSAEYSTLRKCEAFPWLFAFLSHTVFIAAFLSFLSQSFSHFLPYSLWLWYISHFPICEDTPAVLLLFPFGIWSKSNSYYIHSKNEIPKSPEKLDQGNAMTCYSLYLLMFTGQPCPLIRPRLSLSLQLIYVVFSYSYTCAR